jgi:hypothetical protein
MFKLNELKSEAKRVIVRFPLVFVSAFAAIGCILYIMKRNGNDFDETLLMTWAFGLYLGIPLHFSAVLSAEAKGLSGNKRLATLLAFVVAHALLITNLIVVQGDLNSFKKVGVFVFYFISCHLLSSFLPFLVGMKREYFWNFNQWMFSRFVLSSVFGFVISSGLGLAFGAIQLLFGETDETFISQIIFLVTSSFHVFFFFAGTPTELNKGNWIVEPPKTFRILVQYILVPLIVLYLSILYIYLAKILFTFDLPKGNVSIWILVFCTLGILTILLAEPFRNMESNWVGKLAKIFYWLMLPLLVMLWIAICTRVLAYGLTESRALVLYLAIWLTFISLYNGFYKKKSLLAFPISLFIIAFLYQWGVPLSAHSISFKSQSSRTEEIMSRDKIDQEELRSQLYYMYYYQSEHTDWFESNQLPVKVRGGLGSYDLVSDLIDSDRFRNKLIQSSSADEKAVESGIKYVNVNLNEIFVQGFNELHFLTFGSKAKISDFTITYKNNGKEIIREFKNEFYSFCKALDRQAANQPAFTYDWFEDGKQFRLVIYEYNYPFAPSSSEGSSVGEGVLLVK